MLQGERLMFHSIGLSCTRLGSRGFVPGRGLLGATGSGCTSLGDVGAAHYASPIVWRRRCSPPGAISNTSSTALVVSTQTKFRYSSSPQSGMSPAFSTHGFQITVVR